MMPRILTQAYIICITTKQLLLNSPKKCLICLFCYRIKKVRELYNLLNDILEFQISAYARHLECIISINFIETKLECKISLITIQKDLLILPDNKSECFSFEITKILHETI